MMKTLFITRAYPPDIGGIQKQNYEIFRALSELSETRIIANKRGKIVLPVFVFTAFLKAILHARRSDVILLGDGVLGITGYFIKLFSGKPVVCIVHGLDLTYGNKLYQMLWPGYFLKKMDKLIAVGNETIRQGVLHGLAKEKFVFIPNGVSAVEKIHAQGDLKTVLGRVLPGPAILTLGRLVKRKGVEWFVSNVMPELPDNVTYIIAGDGKEKSAIQKAIDQHQLQKRVIFLGTVTDEEKSILMSSVDVFVQPNIHVDGDMEGFGLVVLEAAAYGTPVVAANIEGLKDAIHQNKNGLLVESGNVAAYQKVLMSLLKNTEETRSFGRLSRKYVEENFSWASIAAQYIEVFNKL